MKSERVKREVIENVLLTALNEEGKVAILLSKEELDKLIAFLQMANYRNQEWNEEANEMADDFVKLWNHAFGGGITNEV